VSGEIFVTEKDKKKNADIQSCGGPVWEKSVCEEANLREEETKKAHCHPNRNCAKP
jgi:hypothetical protein